MCRGTAASSHCTLGWGSVAGCFGHHAGTSGADGGRDEQRQRRRAQLRAEAQARREKAEAARVDALQNFGVLRRENDAPRVARKVYGAVVDFVHLHWGRFSWYIFNVADACITIGVLLLVARALLLGEKAGQADAKPSVD